MLVYILVTLMTGGEIDGRQFNLRLSILICKMGLSSSHKREDLKLQTSWPLRTGLQEGLKSADLMYRGQKSQKLTCADPLRIDPDILLLKKRSRCTSVSFCHIIISWPMFKWTGTETKLLEDCPPWMSCVPVLCTEYTGLN